MHLPQESEQSIAIDTSFCSTATAIKLLLGDGKVIIQAADTKVQILTTHP